MAAPHHADASDALTIDTPRPPPRSDASLKILILAWWLSFVLSWLDGWQYNASIHNNQLSVSNHDKIEQEYKSHARRICLGSL